MAEWPGADRRRVALSSPTYAVREPLARWLEAEAREAGRGVRVLDVGCGVKPYYPFFAANAAAYVGVDVPGNPVADLEGFVEALPVADGSFDVVLCVQVLEHCQDPVAAVRELRRVTAPGGRVLASTHGVYPFHPSPVDFWRWTRTGLERLFSEAGDWASVSVRPGSGTASCMTMLLAFYADLAAKRARVRPLARPVVAGLNALGDAVDAHAPTLREPRPGSLAANYHVTARR